jgi:T5orf172 domain
MSIYFLQRRDGLIKIGTTRDIGKRVRALQKSHGILAILKTIEGGLAEERAIHRRFKRHHEFGEWFRPEAELLSFIETQPTGISIEHGRTTKTDQWRAGEAEEVRKASDYSDKLLTLRRQRGAFNQDDAITVLNEDYGFPAFFLKNVLNQRVQSVSAHSLNALREAYRAELEAFILTLKADLVAAQAGLPTHEDALLHTRIAAAKAARIAKRGGAQ